MTAVAYYDDNKWHSKTEQDLAGLQLEVVDKPRRRKETLISIHRLWMNVHTMFGLCEKIWWAT